MRYFGNQYDAAEVIKLAKIRQLLFVNAGKVAGAAGNVLTVISTAGNAYQYYTGEISTGRFIYRFGGATVTMTIGSVSGPGGGVFVAELGYDHVLTPAAAGVRTLSQSGFADQFMRFFSGGLSGLPGN